jgi:transposase
MMSKKNLDGRNQVQMVTLDSLVPKNHLVRKIDAAIDFDFIYELVMEHYSAFGAPSIDPVVLIKICMIQYLFGIRSMRKTIEEIETNIAYRWFLGYGMEEEIPHFSTFGKNYARRFEGTKIFEQIFNKILMLAVEEGFVDPTTVFIDGTHVKADANKNKRVKVVVKGQTRSYKAELESEINTEREKHGQKPLKKKTIRP